MPETGLLQYGLAVDDKDKQSHSHNLFHSVSTYFY